MPSKTHSDHIDVHPTAEGIAFMKDLQAALCLFVCICDYGLAAFAPLTLVPSALPQFKYSFIGFFIWSYPVQTQSRSGSLHFRLYKGNPALHIYLILIFFLFVCFCPLLEASKVRAQSQKYRICCSLGTSPTTCQSFCSFFICLITWLYPDCLLHHLSFLFINAGEKNPSWICSRSPHALPAHIPSTDGSSVSLNRKPRYSRLISPGWISYFPSSVFCPNLFASFTECCLIHSGFFHPVQDFAEWQLKACWIWKWRPEEASAGAFTRRAILLPSIWSFLYICVRLSALPPQSCKGQADLRGYQDHRGCCVIPTQSPLPFFFFLLQHLISVSCTSSALCPRGSQWTTAVVFSSPRKLVNPGASFI